MNAHPPRRRQLVPLCAQERQRRAAQAEERRAEQARKDAQQRPARLAALRTGPALRDLDAAADCGCSCHPRLAELELHDGGVACPCQKTPEERTQAWDDLFAEIDARGPDPGVEAGETELARAAEALGVCARWRCLAAPFVITGRVDGRGFYLRERHGDYCVTVADDDDPAADPWELPAERSTLDIAEGSEEDLLGPEGGFCLTQALTVAVDAVRTFLARRACSHEQPWHEEHVFCSRCGVRFAEADRWAESHLDAGPGNRWSKECRDVSW
ncbi:MAG: hypothetical protein ACRDUV_25785 [Pseudonocardiaceae bacterium]